VIRESINGIGFILSEYSVFVSYKSIVVPRRNENIKPHFQLFQVTVGCGNKSGVTPTAVSASLYLKLCNFLEGALIEVLHSNLNLLTILWYSLTVNFLRFFWEHKSFFKSLYKYLRTAVFVSRAEKKSENFKDIHSTWKKSQECERFQFWAGYLNQGGLQQIMKLQVLTHRVCCRCRTS
jgi:hypothetical protein